MMVEITSELNYMSPEESQIRNTFAGSAVFLTGGTGFLGKLLIEKLLRSCPEIRKIYILARPKKNKTIAERLQEQFNDVVYDRLRKECPDFIQKITAIEGDVSLLNLGIKDKDRKELSEEVQFIFHGAATVRFDETLKVATEINVRGSREMMILARSCKKLRAFVHISTAYSNCVEKNIDEKLYQIPVTGENLIYLVENMDEEILVNMTPALVGKYPNTYVFTKCAAEHIVRNYSNGLPVAICRPSIVTSTAEEPVPGWTDNINGPTGVVVGAGLGVLHVWPCNPEAITDMVPGDMVANACIAIGWMTARDFARAQKLKQNPMVYNYVSSVQNPLTWKVFMKYIEKHGLQNPSKNAVWYYSFSLIKSKFLFKILFFMLQWIPAYIVDGIAVTIGKKPILKKATAKMNKLMTLGRFFSEQEWKFTNNNIQTLFEQMCNADKKLFNFDMNTLKWNDYFRIFIIGLKSYITKESPDKFEGLQRQKKLFILHYVTLINFYLALCWFVIAMCRKFRILQFSWQDKVMSLSKGIISFCKI